MLPGHGLIQGSGEEDGSAIIRPNGGRAIVESVPSASDGSSVEFPWRLANGTRLGGSRGPEEAVEFLERPLQGSGPLRGQIHYDDLLHARGEESSPQPFLLVLEPAGGEVGDYPPGEFPPPSLRQPSTPRSSRARPRGRGLGTWTTTRTPWWSALSEASGEFLNL